MVLLIYKIDLYPLLHIFLLLLYFFHEILVSGKSISEKQELLEKNGFIVDYITELDGRLYAAVFLEGVRLIDNV